MTSSTWTPGCRWPRRTCPWSPPTPTSAAGASPRPCRPARTWWSAPGSPTRAWSPGPPPDTLKVALAMLGGYRNTTTMVLTGLDIEEKAEQAVALLTEVLGGTGQFGEFDVRLLRYDHPDAPSNEQATAHLRVTVKDQDESKVGRAFSNAATELALAGYAGFHTTSPPTAASAFGVYWPAVIPAALVTQEVHLPDGRTQSVRPLEYPPPTHAPLHAG